MSEPAATSAQVTEDLEAAIAAVATPDRANIALFGATGAGKSTLLNSVFGAEIAKTDVGDPVTKDTELFVNEAGTLGIYDGAGLELGDKSPFKDLGRRILRNRKVGDWADLIHVAWYCVNSATGRLEEGQKKAIRELHERQIPVVLVLTKVSVRDGVVDPETVRFAEAIADMNLPIVTGRPIITAAVDDEFNGIARHGLENLLETTYSVVPEAQKVALAAAQKIDLSIKLRYARSWIAGAVAFAGGVGATPIPLADAAVLVPAQVALMAKIASIYDIPRAQAAKLISSVPALAAAGGKVAAANLIKLVPGVGLVISASVAGTVTAVLGESWRVASERVFVGKLNLESVENVTNIANSFVKDVKSGTGGSNGTAATP